MIVLLGLVAAALLLRLLLSGASTQTAPARRGSSEARQPRRTSIASAAESDIEIEIGSQAEAMAPRLEAEVARLHADLLGELAAESSSREGDPEADVLGLREDPGPTWMFPEEWAERVVAYRAQGRTPSEIWEVAEYLERRGARVPMDPKQRIERAKSLGYVARDEYLSPDDEALALRPTADGFPDAWLDSVRDRLLVVTPRGWVNPKSRTAASRAGLWSFAIRGTAHHQAAATRGDFRPGQLVGLVREPDNPHDPNAIAVYANEGTAPAGYVPRGYAKRLSKLLDSGVGMVAVSTRGSGPRHDEPTPHVLAVERDLWDHLNRAR